MRVTPHSALAISTCALALLSQISSVHSYNGVFEEGESALPPTFAQQHVMKHQKELGLSDIRWSSKNNKMLSIARVTWDKQDAIMKCAIVSVSGPISSESGINIHELTTAEVNAFSALKEAKDKLIAKKLADVYAAGQENVMDPLHRFDFYEENRIRYFCHLYGFIHGETLEDYFKKQTVTQTFITAAGILPKIIKGLIYLYNAGLFIMICFRKLDSNRRIIGVKIIDLDSASILKKEQDWQPINLFDDRNLSPNPPQKYESCNELKKTITFLMGMFVPLGKEDPSHKRKLTEQDALKHLKKVTQFQAISGGSKPTQAQTNSEQRLPPRVDTTGKSRFSWSKLRCF
ncbi:hypothetical protein BDF22DRAFT_778323 [Syncephalis plumigaleata]|nr:hypothetical protein BDF22DRAFT_778323 [Syncephalis plumigaleata]